MEQHAIPQNVSSYQFKLVGDMTLKQFFQLAGGFLVAFILYSLPILGIIKWPFVILSAILGIALAFLPLEERPLERWIFAFFKAIYTPTEFIWKRSSGPQKFFQDEPVGGSTVSTSPEQDAALKAYLATSRQNPGSLAKLEGAEQGFLTAIAGIFAGLKSQASPTVNSQQLTNQPEKPKAMEIPVSNPIKIGPAGVPHMVVEEKLKVETPATQFSTQQVAPIIAGNEIISTKQAIFSVDAAPPNPPTSANIVVGQVVDQDRRIVEGAIMEIRDEAGRPIRALRSNRVGHFITVTPLDNGRYDIITDKEGYQFAPASFDATGAIIPPILVEGRRTAVTETVPVQQPIVKSYMPN